MLVVRSGRTIAEDTRRATSFKSTNKKQNKSNAWQWIYNLVQKPSSNAPWKREDNIKVLSCKLFSQIFNMNVPAKSCPLHLLVRTNGNMCPYNEHEGAFVCAMWLQGWFVPPSWCFRREWLFSNSAFCFHLVFLFRYSFFLLLPQDLCLSTNRTNRDAVWRVDS